MNLWVLKMNKEGIKKIGKILRGVGELVEGGKVEDITPKQIQMMKMLGDEIIKSNISTSKLLEENNRKLLRLINEELSKELDR